MLFAISITRMSRKAIKPRNLAAWFTANPTQRQEDLAKRLGIGQAHVSMLVNGERTPSLRLALRIEDITGVPVSALVAPPQEEASR